MSRHNEFVVNFKFTDTSAHACTCIFIYTMFKEKWNLQYIPYFVMHVCDHERMQLESSNQRGCNWEAEEQTWLGSSSWTDVIKEQQSRRIQLGSNRWRRNWGVVGSGHARLVLTRNAIAFGMSECRGYAGKFSWYIHVQCWYCSSG